MVEISTVFKYGRGSQLGMFLDPLPEGPRMSHLHKKSCTHLPGIPNDRQHPSFGP